MEVQCPRVDGRDSRHRDWKPMRARTSETHRHSVPVGADDGQRLTCFVRKSASISLVGFLPKRDLAFGGDDAELHVWIRVEISIG